MLALAGLAPLSGWGWWCAGYALVAFGAGRWLARGFEYNRQRVFFEAEMMAKGMALSEVRTEWVEAYTGN